MLSCSFCLDFLVIMPQNVFAFTRQTFAVPQPSVHYAALNTHSQFGFFFVVFFHFFCLYGLASFRPFAEKKPTQDWWGHRDCALLTRHNVHYRFLNHDAYNMLTSNPIYCVIMRYTNSLFIYTERELLYFGYACLLKKKKSISSLFERISFFKTREIFLNFAWICEKIFKCVDNLT